MRGKIILLLGAMCPLALFAQSIHFQRGVSVRNYQLGHYYRMVTWEDSHYEEFAYYETNENGAIKNFMNWRIAFPPGYDKNANKKYPTILMLHGAGESGRVWSGRYQYTPEDPEYDNNGRHLLFGAVEHYQAMKRATSHPRSFPGIVVFPQVSANGAWVGHNLTMAARIMEYLIDEYDVDPFRIFVHGLSNGGKGVWQFTTERPDLFSAALPMSGVGVDIEAMTDTLVTMPIWLFQGELDKNPSPGWSKQWIQMLKQKGGKPRYTLYEDTGHGTWKQAYAEPDFFSWILQHDKRNIYYFGDTTHLPTAEKPLKLGFSAGFLGYQWTRNGQDIPGATGRYYTATQAGRYAVKFKQKIGNQEWAESFELDLTGPATCISTAIPDIKADGHTGLPLPFEESVDHTLRLLAKAGYEKYSWYKDGEFVQETEANVLVLNNAEGTKFKAGDAGKYSVIGADENGCTTLFSKPLAVTWHAPGSNVSGFEPYLHTAGNVQLPLPDSVEDQSLYLWAPAGHAGYRWYLNGELVKETTEAYLQLNNASGEKFARADTGTYRVEIVGAGGSTSFLSNSSSITLETLDVYEPALAAAGSTDLPLNDSVADKSLTLVAPEGFNYYKWYKNDLLVRESKQHVLVLDDETGALFTQADTGSYRVVVANVERFPSVASAPVVVTYDNFPGYEPYVYATNSPSLPLPASVADKSLALVAPEGYPTYRWFKDSVLVQESNEAVLVLNDEAGELFKPEDAGVYFAILKNEKGRWSLASNPVQITYKGELRAYSSPSFTSAFALSTKEIELSWTDMDYEERYEIWRTRESTIDNTAARVAGYPGEAFQLIAELPADVTTFTDSRLRPGAQYGYVVRAIHAGEGRLLESDTARLLTKDDSTAPVAPSALEVTLATESEVRLSWQPSSDDDAVYGYEVFMGGEKLATLFGVPDSLDQDPTDGHPAPDTTYLVTGLKARQLYEFKVRAIDYQGNAFQGNVSPFSNTVRTQLILGASSEADWLADFIVYPNPFHTNVSVKLPEGVPAGQPIMILDHSGRLIRNAGATTANREITIDFSGVVDGLYLINIGKHSFRVVKRN